MRNVYVSFYQPYQSVRVHCILCKIMLFKSRNMLKDLLFLLGAFTCATFAEFTSQDCRELGFIKAQLMCSSCDKLDDFGLDAIKSHCKECCTPDTLPAAQRRWPKAILEVCTCKFRAYPQIEAFIKSGRPAKYSNLQIKYMRGLDPTVKLLDAKGNVQETLSITKWNTDTVDEFFDTHLEKPGGSKSEKSAYSVVEEEEDTDFLETNRI